MTWPRARLAVLVVALALAAPGLSQVRVLLDGCVPVGAVTPLGLRLAVLADAASCPQGTVGLGPVGRGAVLVASVAMPALVAQLGVAAAAAAAVGAGLRCVHALARTGCRVLAVVLPAAPVPVPARVASLTAPGPPVRPARVWAATAWSRRGPPVAV